MKDDMSSFESLDEVQDRFATYAPAREAEARTFQPELAAQQAVDRFMVTRQAEYDAPFAESYPPDMHTALTSTYSPGGDTQDVVTSLPYVDHAPEIIARDHAPDVDRIDQTLTAAGAPAATRWAARMNATKAATAYEVPDLSKLDSIMPGWNNDGPPTANLNPTQDQLNASMGRHPSVTLQPPVR